jgi:two-component system, OmpR family, sensor histidine kinase ResE
VIRNSIVAKLWLTIVAMVVLVFALLSILLQQFFDGYVIQQQTQQLTSLATSVRTILLQDGIGTATRTAREMAANVQHAEIDFGVPMSSNAGLNHAYQSFTPDERMLFNHGQPVTQRLNSGNKNITVYVMLPLNNGSNTGMLSVSQQMSVLEAPLTRMRNLIIFASVLGVVLATGLAFVVSKNLSRPLIQMNEVAEQMATGNFAERVSVVTKDEVGRLGKTFNTLADELSQTIRDLSVERDQLSSILASLEDGVVASDLDGNVTLANPPALRWMRSMSLGEKGLVDTSCLPETLGRFLIGIMEASESILRDIVWQGRTLIVIVTPLYESDGKSRRGVLFVLRDVTEERRLDRLRKDFIANVSHELRTPLSMMQGYAEALLDEFGDDPVNRQELTEIIYDETLRMKRLVNDLLDLAQLESGQFQMKYSEIDISQFVKRVTRKFYTLSQDKQVKLVADCPDSAVYILGDKDRLEQVLTNLLDNAFRHTKEGSVTVEVFRGKENVQIKVKDTGSGIPEEDIPFIFERFYKADKARTRSSSGTGLGLAITKHIITEHGGDVLVHSTLAEGTEFDIVLPLAKKVV